MISSILDGITLVSGAHNIREDGMCAMEAVAWLAGEKHSDHPKCACPVIAQIVRVWNDSLPDEDRQRLLKPLLPALVGTRSTPEVEEQRAYMALDWLVRTHTAAWLRVAKLTDDADALAGLPAITDLKTAKAARAVVRVVEKRVDAAWAAARAADWDAAWDTSWAAAWAVISAATRATARADAVDTARATAWADSLNAARAAAVDTAVEAALRLTVAELQESCADLIWRMAAIRTITA